MTDTAKLPEGEEVSAEGTTDVVIHMCPPSGSGVMPCCGLPPFERLSDRMTSDPELVSCWFLDDIAAAEADLKTGRVKTLEQLRSELRGTNRDPEETQMTNPIRWCTRHKSSTNPYDDDDSQCIVATCVVGVMSQCRMVTATVSIPHDAGLIPTIPHDPKGEF